MTLKKKIILINSIFIGLIYLLRIILATTSIKILTLLIATIIDLNVESAKNVTSLMLMFLMLFMLFNLIKSLLPILLSIMMTNENIIKTKQKYIFDSISNVFTIIIVNLQMSTISHLSNNVDYHKINIVPLLIFGIILYAIKLIRKLWFNLLTENISKELHKHITLNCDSIEMLSEQIEKALNLTKWQNIVSVSAVTRKYNSKRKSSTTKITLSVNGLTQSLIIKFTNK